LAAPRAAALFGGGLRGEQDKRIPTKHGLGNENDILSRHANHHTHELAVTCRCSRFLDAAIAARMHACTTSYLVSAVERHSVIQFQSGGQKISVELRRLQIFKAICIQSQYGKARARSLSGAALNCRI
jgi:hypothetical protein